MARLDDAGFGHFQPEVVAFARAFAHASKHREPAVLLGNVVDQLHDDDGLSYAGTTKQSDLAALQEGLDQVDHFHAGFEHLGGRRLLVKQGRRTMNGQAFLEFDRTQLVDGFADYVHHASQRAAAHGHGNRPTLIDDLHAAHHPVSRLHSHAAHPAFAQVLLHFENHVDGIGDAETFADHLQRLINGRHGGFLKLHVHRWSCNLYDVSDIFWHKTSKRHLAVSRQRLVLRVCCRRRDGPMPAAGGHPGSYPAAAAPLTISMISFVILACRARFMASVSESIMSVALLVADSMAVMRAACSAATDSSKAWKIPMPTYFGSSERNSSAGGCW